MNPAEKSPLDERKQEIVAHDAGDQILCCGTVIESQSPSRKACGCGVISSDHENRRSRSSSSAENVTGLDGIPCYAHSDDRAGQSLSTCVVGSSNVNESPRVTFT